MPAQPQVAKLVSTHLAPLLKENGWRKKALTFERRNGDTTQVIHIQPSRGSSSFYVNVGLVIDAVQAMSRSSGELVFGSHVVTHGERLDGWQRGMPADFSALDPDVVGPQLRAALAKLMPRLDRLDSVAACRQHLKLSRGFQKVLRAQLAWLDGDRDAARSDLEAVAQEFADRPFVSFASLARRAGLKGL